MSNKLRVAVVGATGMVGETMLRVLEERRFPLGSLIPIASDRSAGKTVRFHGRDIELQAASAELFQGVDVALFSAGSSVSKQWGPIAAAHGAWVIDNSSAFRQDADVPLVVPEVNGEALASAPRRIIANPNCATIQMVVALAPIHRAYRVRRIVVATYQAISGKGARALQAFDEQMEDSSAGRDTLAGQLSQNLLMHWTPDLATGYSDEELKIIFETRKILGDTTIAVSPTCVRVPVRVGHSEAITIATEIPMTAVQARALLEKADGVTVVDEDGGRVYPQPLHAAGKDDVFVGRIRDDLGNPGGIQLWVVSDNVRKGAATNAVQIAERLSQMGLLRSSF